MPPAHPESDAGLYIHVPFCTSVCPYCDFAVTIAGKQRRQGWVDGVVREAQMYSDRGLRFDTVYFGGGTPSSLEPEQLATIIDGLWDRLEVAPDATLFLEINPEDVSRARVAEWRDLGMHFVSLGVQSFDDDDLEFLGRRHSAADARRAVDMLCDGGFDTVSIDLIYGVEGRTEAHWRQQLETALSSGAEHVSCYQLTVHEETLFGRRVARGEVAELDDDAQSRLFFLTHRIAADAGFDGYEVSNFALAPAHRSRHNQKYWDHTPYLGLGPSAHSFAGGRRWWNRRKLRLWQVAVDLGEFPVEGSEQPSRNELLLEALMLGFRTTAGVDLNRLQSQCGIGLLDSNRDVIDQFCESGHLSMEGRQLRPTVAGMAVADTLARAFSLDVTEPHS
jgi:oxygen-independent coproporphyrinogen-3 oxidase